MADALDPIDEHFTRDWTEWRAEWERNLTAPHGWLSARALHWLDDAPRRRPGLPGRWSQDHDAVVVDPEGTEMSFDGETFRSTRRLPLAGGPDDRRVTAGDLEIGITHRGTYLILVYDPDAPARREFRGVPTFAPSPDWVLTGHYEPYESSRTVSLRPVDPNLDEHAHDTPGHVRFTYGGHTHTLQLIRSGGMPIAVFTDGTSGTTTYAAGRSLPITDIGDDGRVRLDFNRTVNLPCAFSDKFPICPVPPPGNRLPFPVEAGERTPREKTG
ncbi:DUF1684 domain-containing protein [Streptomyces mobaraensis]|uniref:DUF1684 domain-containing protein n=1 Tax=Streptomyces mobaraensis TaxID=35621 RepID=UPI00331E35C7